MIRDLSASCTVGLGQTSPSFEMFQSVRSHFSLDDGSIDDRHFGVVTGIVYAPTSPDLINVVGWAYFVTWFVLPSAPSLLLPHTELILESQLAIADNFVLG